jgi:hypothetical protein
MYMIYTYIYRERSIWLSHLPPFVIIIYITHIILVVMKSVLNILYIIYDEYFRRTDYRLFKYFLKNGCRCCLLMCFKIKCRKCQCVNSFNCKIVMYVEKKRIPINEHENQTSYLAEMTISHHLHLTDI